MSGTIRSYEDIIAWRKARALAHDVYRVTRKPEFNRDFGLSSQIQRAAVSVMANIAEGFKRRSTKDFERFLIIAKASCAEVVSHPYIALDVGCLTQAEFADAREKARETSRVIAGFRASMKPETRNSVPGTRN